MFFFYIYRSKLLNTKESVWQPPDVIWQRWMKRMSVKFPISPGHDAASSNLSHSTEFDLECWDVLLLIQSASSVLSGILEAYLYIMAGLPTCLPSSSAERPELPLAVSCYLVCYHLLPIFCWVSTVVMGNIEQ